MGELVCRAGFLRNERLFGYLVFEGYLLWVWLQEKPKANRDPYIIHLNIALSMVVPLYFGVEKATCFKWLQNVSFKEPWETTAVFGVPKARRLQSRAFSRDQDRDCSRD